MSFPGKCKSCGKKFNFNVTDKVQDTIYCSDSCWEAHWLKTGIGLIHPRHKNTILKFPKAYGGELSCTKFFKFVSGVKGINA